MKKWCSNSFLIGLELEYEERELNGLNFIKLHATLEVLRRYSEILKLRMPMKEVTSLFSRQYIVWLMHCASCFQRWSLFQSTGVSSEKVHKLDELVVEMLNDACYINVCLILDGYRVTKFWGIEFQEVKVSCFVAVTSVCVSISEVLNCYIHSVTVLWTC
jgi:hypothetical protein